MESAHRLAHQTENTCMSSYLLYFIKLLLIWSIVLYPASRSLRSFLDKSGKRKRLCRHLQVPLICRSSSFLDESDKFYRKSLDNNDRNQAEPAIPKTSCGLAHSFVPKWRAWWLDGHWEGFVGLRMQSFFQKQYLCLFFCVCDNINSK